MSIPQMITFTDFLPIAAFDFVSILPFAAFGAIAIGAWVFVDMMFNSKTKSESRLERMKNRSMGNSDIVKSQGSAKEVIMAVSPTIEGDTTIFYISKKLKDLNVKISTIARGVSFGGELEYADEITLGRSIVARVPYRLKEE